MSALNVFPSCLASQDFALLTSMIKVFKTFLLMWRMYDEFQMQWRLHLARTNLREFKFLFIAFSAQKLWCFVKCSTQHILNVIYCFQSRKFPVEITISCFSINRLFFLRHFHKVMSEAKTDFLHEYFIYTSMLTP